MVISIGVFLIVTLLMVVFANRFAKQLVAPIIKLSKLAEAIASGNLEENIENNILVRKDEIGSLSNSFNVMVKNLRDKIAQLSNSQKEIEIKNQDLERMNKLMVGRELKMSDMKKELEAYKNNKEG